MRVRNLSRSGYGPVEGSSDHGNGPSDSLKCRLLSSKRL
jgi:hypothetical protein